VIYPLPVVLLSIVPSSYLNLLQPLRALASRTHQGNLVETPCAISAYSNVQCRDVPFRVRACVNYSPSTIVSMKMALKIIGIIIPHQTLPARSTPRKRFSCVHLQWASSLSNHHHPLAVVPLGRRGTLCPCFVCCWRLLIAISGMRLRRAGRNLWGKRASGEWKRASSVEMGYTYGFPPKAQDDRLWTGT
jgi:hypothetical protein